MRNRLFVYAAAAALAVAVAGVDAYVLKSQKWPSSKASQIPYYINPQNGDVSADAAEAAVRAGASVWSAQSNASMSWYYMGRTTDTTVTSNSKNIVLFRNTSNGGAIATTYWWADGSNNLLDTDIVLWDGGIKFFTGTTGCSSGAFIEDITAHEFGHAAGLAHTTVNPATMYSSYSPWCSMSMRNLSSDDKAGIEKLYPPTSSTSSTSSTTVPTAPGGLTAAQNATSPSSSLKIAWVDYASNESGFAIERSTSGGTYSEVARVGTNVVSYVNSSLASGTTYSYRVRAYNSGGYSAYSNAASATTQSVTTSSAAITLTASGYKRKGLQYAALSWKGTTATYADVYRNGVKKTTVPNSGSYTDSLNTKGSGSYTFRVCASGSTTCSNTATVSF